MKLKINESILINFSISLLFVSILFFLSFYLQTVYSLEKKIEYFHNFKLELIEKFIQFDSEENGETIQEEITQLFNDPDIKSFLTIMEQEDLYNFLYQNTLFYFQNHETESALFQYYFSSIKPILEELTITTDYHFQVYRDKLFYLAILLFVLLFIISFFLLFASLYRKRQISLDKLKIEHANELSFSQEQKMKQIAYDLHDDIAQKLVYLQSYLAYDSDNTILRKQEAENVLLSVIKKVRYLSHSLESPDFLKLSLYEAIDGLCKDFELQHPGGFSYTLTGLDNLNLSKNSSLHVYRIIQEILQNSKKHAQATVVNLKVVYTFPNLIIRYFDNGKGFKNEARNTVEDQLQHFGLNSLYFRTQILNGKIDINSAPNKGVKIDCMICLSGEDNEENSFSR